MPKPMHRLKIHSEATAPAKLPEYFPGAREDYREQR